MFTVVNNNNNDYHYYYNTNNNDNYNIIKNTCMVSPISYKCFITISQ